MNDLKNLLERALDDAPAADVEIDPAADLVRGRSRLLHRRKVTLASTAAVALGLAIVPLALNGTTGPASQNQAGSKVSSGIASPKALPSLELVAYTGKQIPGYRVASVPEGWVIQGGDSYVLTIAPKGFKDKMFDSFVGKLVVMLASKEAGAPTQGDEQEVDGRPGWLNVEGDTQVLTYQLADERWVTIQAPTSLGWTGAQIAEFATGVEVLANAEAARG